MPDLNVFAPYAQARQAGQRNRLALLQNQLAARRSQNQSMGLLQLQEAMRRKREEEQRQAEANDPYRRMQIAKLLQDLSNPPLTRDEKFADFQREYDYRRANPIPRVGGGGSGNSKLTGIAITLANMRLAQKPEYLSLLSEQNRIASALMGDQIDMGYYQSRNIPLSPEALQEKLYGEFAAIHGTKKSMLEKLLPQAVADAASMYGLEGSEADPYGDDLGDPSAEAIWEAYH